MPLPNADDFGPFFDHYVSQVPEADILPALEGQLEEFVSFLRSVPESQVGVHHAPYTWTFREVVGHLTDGERVFGHRAHHIARGDANPLPGFDEMDYAKAAGHDRFAYKDLVDEFEAVRKSNLCMFRLLDAESWNRRGVANGHPMTVNAMAYILVGHVRHHGTILRKRLA